MGFLSPSPLTIKGEQKGECTPVAGGGGAINTIRHKTGTGQTGTFVLRQSAVPAV